MNSSPEDRMHSELVNLRLAHLRMEAALGEAVTKMMALEEDRKRMDWLEATKSDCDYEGDQAARWRVCHGHNKTKSAGGKSAREAIDAARKRL